MKQLTPQAITILEKRYLRRDQDGKLIETPVQMFSRVAKAVAGAEIGLSDQVFWTRKFYDIMSNLRFLPNSPTLMNAGTGAGSLSACFVIPVEDSMEGITKASHDAAMVQKFGGGTGFGLSRIRAKGTSISTTHGRACGPVAVLKYLSATSSLVTQGGKRDGANMAILKVDHPDIREFIHCKDDGESIHNFNISIGVTDDFMSDIGGYTINSYGDAVASLESELWKEIIESAHKTGDPGLWFIDRVNAGKGNPISSLGPIESCNPCGEQELYPFDSCNLGSINLGAYVNNDGSIRWSTLREDVATAVRFLDNVVTINTFPLPEVAALNEQIRRIGLGVMGWHDMLLKRGTPYDSEEAINLAMSIMCVIQGEADQASSLLAEDRGDFPLWDESIYGRKGRFARVNGLHMRNSTRTTIAPTGTISLIAGCSSGIEPVFSFEYKHAGLEGSITETFKHPLYSDGADPAVFKTAMQIDPIWHLRHQAAFQKYTDNAVSKTINLPASATVKDVKMIYETAYDLGCKGVTIYRDGSKAGQVLVDVSTQGDVNVPRGVDQHEGRGQGDDHADTGDVSGPDRQRPTEPDVQHLDLSGTRPNVLPGSTFRQPTAFGNLYVTITELGGEPYEVFSTVGKTGGDVQAMTEYACRLTSKLLRACAPGTRREVLREVIEQGSGIGGSLSSGFGAEKVRSIPDAIAKVLGRYLDGGNRAESSHADRRDSVRDSVRDDDVAVLHKGLDLCPDCHQASLVHESGCATCHFCGYSRC